MPNRWIASTYRLQFIINYVSVNIIWEFENILQTYIYLLPPHSSERHQLYQHILWIQLKFRLSAMPSAFKSKSKGDIFVAISNK